MKEDVVREISALFAACVLAVAAPFAAPAQELSPLGIGLEGYAYPYPVAFLPLVNDGTPVRMAYMDVPPRSAPNGATVLLLHGKNFGGYYFRNVIATLADAGYRVVVPDQIGWGKSSKPDIHYSFQLLAANTAALLDRLGIADVAVLGHSTGGMLAVRFTLMYPHRVTRLVLEDPIGLADYRPGIPPQTDDALYDQELHTTDPVALRAFYARYFVHPNRALSEPLADVQIRVAQSPFYPQWARASALAYQMIYQQPVRYEYHLLQPPTLLIVGAHDHTVPLGAGAAPAARAALGDFVELGRAAVRDIPHARLAIVPDCGHIPHLEQPAAFFAALLPFLES
jgi:pimeloyl-ACP methyl ester carboxylesterase